MIKTEIKILIVDDLPTMQKILIHQIKQAGFENVVMASSVIEAMERLQAEKIDLVLSDWRMPDKDGLDLLAAMKTDEALAKISFILITAEDGKENIVKAIKSGVTDYIVKPLSAKILEDKIHEVFTGKHNSNASA